MTTATQRVLQRLESDQPPRLGGFNPTFLAIETRRLLRNRRTVILTLVLPIILFVLLRSNRRVAGVGASELTVASTMIGIAVYGAMLASTSGGAMVSLERALGWSRQLRLTPLRPVAYVAIRIVIAMLLGAASVVAVYTAGVVDGVQMEPTTWLASGILAWVPSLVFAAFGLFLGYLLPTENAMQIIGPILAVFGLLGGLFIPLSLLPSTLQDVAPYVPTYGVVEIARFPLLGGSFDPSWLVSVVGWTLLFAAAAGLLFRRDTRRV